MPYHKCTYSDSEILDSYKNDDLKEYIRLSKLTGPLAHRNGTPIRSILSAIDNLRKNNKKLNVLKHLVNNNLDEDFGGIPLISIDKKRILYLRIQNNSNEHVLKYFIDIGINFHELLENFDEHGRYKLSTNLYAFFWRNSEKYMKYFWKYLVRDRTLLLNADLRKSLSHSLYEYPKIRNELVIDVYTKIFNAKIDESLREQIKLYQLISNITVSKSDGDIYKYILDTGVTLSDFLVLYKSRKYDIINKVISNDILLDYRIFKTTEWLIYNKYYTCCVALKTNLIKNVNFKNVYFICKN